MNKEVKKTNWNIPVSMVLDKALEKAVELDTHSTKADFVRDAVRRRLEEMGFKSTPFSDKHSLDLQEAKQ